MAYIYKITNDINNKVYVGKTDFSIEKRFKEHCNDAFKKTKEKRPLYSAMRKYGIEHFHIELIEECDNPEEREVFWIGYYRGYEDGYNATYGGDGKRLYNHEQILQMLKEQPYPKQIAEQIGCCVDIIYNIAKQNNIKVINLGGIDNVNAKKNIYQYDKKTMEYIQSFDSTVSAAQWCFENQKCATLNSGVRSHIGDCANGKRKSAYGYIWSYEQI